MSSEVVDYRAQVDAVRGAFGREFERFAPFRAAEDAARLTLEEAETLLREVKELTTRFTAKKSAVSQLMKLVGRVPAEERAGFGQSVQQLDTEIRDALAGAQSALVYQIARIKQERERVDVTLPGRRPHRGHLHPITLVRQQIEDIFVSMGYTVEDGPEVETEFYNFTALNIPELHPARSPQDTYYTTDGLALRSQTSTVQIRAMERRGAPLRIIAPGRVFRRDTPDATHNPMFFQVEGLLVDRGITMGDLKGTITEFLRRLVGPGTRTRFRPSYFPFTEPSAEFDFTCFKCHGAGCRLCKGSGWIELGGSGMVHPNVLRVVGIDPEEFSGFAFGFGIDRMCALRYGLDDIRLLFENDVRFLEQFF